jgi:hypothetical protein
MYNKISVFLEITKLQLTFDITKIYYNRFVRAFLATIQ